MSEKPERYTMSFFGIGVWEETHQMVKCPHCNSIECYEGTLKNTHKRKPTEIKCNHCESIL